MADECVNWRIERRPVYPVARHRRDAPCYIGRARIGDRRCRATRLDESNAPKLVVCLLLACCSIRGATRPLPKGGFQQAAHGAVSPSRRTPTPGGLSRAAAKILEDSGAAADADK